MLPLRCSSHDLQPSRETSTLSARNKARKREKVAKLDTGGACHSIAMARQRRQGVAAGADTKLNQLGSTQHAAAAAEPADAVGARTKLQEHLAHPAWRP